MTRALLGIARVAVARWIRGPLLIVALMVLGLSLLALPPSLAIGSDILAWRDDASFALGVIGWVSLVAGALLPIMGGAAHARRAEARLAGDRITVSGHLGASWLLISVVASAGAAETSSWLRWRHGPVEVHGASILHTPVWRNHEGLSCAKKSPIRLTIPIAREATVAGTLRVAATFRVTAATDGPSGPPSLTMRYRTDDSPWRERIVRPDGIGRLVETVSCTQKTTKLHLEFTDPATSASLLAVPGGVVVSGAPVPTFGALFRGALIMAAMGIGVASFVMLMSGHVHSALAVTSGIVVATLASALMTHRADVPQWIELIGRWLPGATPVDPSTEFRAGLAPTWGMVNESLAHAMLWTMLAIGVPPRSDSRKDVA